MQSWSEGGEIYPAAEPKSAARARIRQRFPSRQEEEQVILEREDADAVSEGQSSSTDVLTLSQSNEEQYWARYDQLWPQDVVSQLRNTVWYPKGFSMGDLDHLEDRIDYRQAWVIGLRGCQCLLSHDKYFTMFTDEGTLGTTKAVRVRFDGTDVHAFLRITLPPDERKIFIISAEPLWNAYFNLTLGSVKINATTQPPLKSAKKLSPNTNPPQLNTNSSLNANSPRGSETKGLPKAMAKSGTLTARTNTSNNTSSTATFEGAGTAPWELKLLPNQFIEALLICLW